MDASIECPRLTGTPEPGQAAPQPDAIPQAPGVDPTGIELHNRGLVDLAILKGEFLATVSHELRTPLTSASSLLELMVDADPADPVPTEVVQALRRNVERLVTTVEDLLLLARIEAGQLSFDHRAVVPAALLGDLLEPLRTDATDPGPTVRATSEESDPAVRVLGDPYWLDRMIRFLVSGWLTSDRPGVITMHDAVIGGCWTLTVSGDSLATATFHRDATPCHEPGIGVGLGVILARAIATRHGGELRIEHGPASIRIQVSLPLI